MTSVSKNTFVTLFLILVLLLMFFPLMSTFNDILTRIVINLRGYAFIREVIVPFEVRMVAVILTVLGFDVGVTKGKRLQTAGIIRMTRHVVGTDRAAADARAADPRSVAADPLFPAADLARRVGTRLLHGALERRQRPGGRNG